MGKTTEYRGVLKGIINEIRKFVLNADIGVTRNVPSQKLTFIFYYFL